MSEAEACLVVLDLAWDVAVSKQNSDLAAHCKELAAAAATKAAAASARGDVMEQETHQKVRRIACLPGRSRGSLFS